MDVLRLHLGALRFELFKQIAAQRVGRALAGARAAYQQKRLPGSTNRQLCRAQVGQLNRR